MNRLGGGFAIIVSAALALGATVAAPGAGAVHIAPGDPPSEALLLVVDFSGSMLESDGSGSTRIASAKEALQTIIAALPAPLECLAAAGGGQFTSVQDAGLLAEALTAARTRAGRTFEPRGEPVRGSSALIDAPELEPGTYTDGILSTESLWFAVAADKGQDVTARLTIKTAEVPASAKVGIEWQDTRARRVDARSLPRLSTGQANTLAVSTGRINGTRSTYGGVRDPGLYYFNLRTAGFPAQVEHPFVLEIFVEGEGVVGTETTAPTTQASGSDDEPSSSATAAPVDLPDAPDGGGSGAILLFVAFVLLLALIGYLIRRRRRTMLEGPPPPSY